MPRSSDIIVKSLGLNYSPNELESPPGGMKIASNVVITRENIVEPRRGYKEYSTSFGSSSDRAKQVFEYRQRILTHYNDILLYDTDVINDDGKSVLAEFSQSVTEVTTGLRIKSAQMNGNFYFTTNEGIKKLSLASAAGFSTASITPAGGVTALNINTRLSVTTGSTTGFLPTDSAVAYRVLWLTKDANQNLIRGVPSSRSLIYNELSQMLVRDFLQVLGALDSLNTTGSYINDGNYVSTLKLGLTALPATIRTNMIALAAKLDAEQGTLSAVGTIASGSITSSVCTLTFSSGTRIGRLYQTGDKIYLSDTTLTALNGIQTVVSVAGSGSATPTITFNTTATGTFTTTSASITSGWFRSITQPDVPSVPSTHNDLVGLQTYLAAIIVELQSTRNVRTIAQYNSVPMNISSVSGSGSLVTINVSSASTADPRDYIAAADLIYLSGSFTNLSPSILGLQTVASVSSASFTFAATGTGVYAGTATDTIVRVLRFTNALQTSYISPLALTTTANVYVDVNIPSVIDDTYFLQIYRSDTITATGTDVLDDLTPDDEDRLVYEAYPTAAELSARFLTVLDSTPDSFYQGGAYLYTNADTGEGFAQANYQPPLSKDMTAFQNVMFYSNTQTLQRAALSLLGVTNILADYTNGLAPQITIGNTDYASQYLFVPGVAQVVNLTCGGTSAIATGAYFTLHSMNNLTTYSVWFDKTGSDTNPSPAGTTSIRVSVSGLTTAAQVSQAASDAISLHVDDFTTTVNTGTGVVTITCASEGVASAPVLTVGLSAPFALAVATTGAGQNVAKEITSITCVAGNLYKTSGVADYFTLNTPFSRERYYVWFQVTGGTMTDPAVSGRTGVAVAVLNTDNSTQVATKVAAVVDALSTYTASSLSAVVTATTVQSGPTVDATNHVANGGFSLSVTQQGALNVLLSSSASPAIAVEATALSLVDVINKDLISDISAYYVSGPTDIPGKISFSAKDFLVPQFYIQSNTALTGASFSPNIAPALMGITNTAANPTVVTLAAHGLVSGDQVFIGASNSIPSIDGVYTVTVVSSSTFTVDLPVYTGGTTGVLTKTVDVEASDDEVKPNRIYYSKFQQPEAVPLLNYLDVGDPDKAILRIYALKQSLFVFKEEGLYRVSGTSAPYQVDIFDWSVKIVCPDSLATANNFLFCYSRKGISIISENGADVVSKQIYNKIISLNNDNYTNFSTASWGVGYESDFSYMFFTVSEYADAIATIVYRYSTLTGSWTTFDISDTCGIVKTDEDKLYLGSGTSNDIRQERKSFTREDYADTELPFTTTSSSYISDGQTVTLSSVREVSIGDVFLQEQKLTPFLYNLLLQKLDLDPTIAPAYTVTNFVVSGSSATVSFSGSVSAFLQVNDYVVFSNINPIVLNGTFKITSVPSSNSIVVNYSTTNSTATNTYISGGTGKYSYYSSMGLGYGADLRDGLESLAAKLDIDPGITSHVYTSLIADHVATGVSASISNPTVVTSPSHGLDNNRYILVSSSTTSPSTDGNYAVTAINANTFSIPVAVVGAGTLNYETLITNVNDIQACYNIIINQLNLDQGPSFSNYATISGTTTVEAIITDINYSLKRVTLNIANLNFTTGPVKVYKSYESEVEYLPITMQNPLYLKQFSEAQVLFLNKTFTSLTLNFASDLVPVFTPVVFTGYGNGIFGNEAFGENYFGGDSHSAPFITYVPRNNQKCRFLRLNLSHRIARESFSLLGITVTGRLISTRAYR